MTALLNWLREEWRLMRLNSWQNEPMGPKHDFLPCSSEDPRCAETIQRLAECRERMRRMRSGLLDAPERKFTDAASTDVAATIRKAQAVGFGPVRAVARRAAR